MLRSAVSMNAWHRVLPLVTLVACSTSREEPIATAGSGGVAVAAGSGGSGADGAAAAGANGGGGPGGGGVQAGSGGAPGGGEAGAGGDVVSGPLFRPPAGQTLLIVGQDLDSIQGYTESVWPSPGGVTTYTRIDENPWALPGLRTLVNDGAGDLHASELVSRYPDSVLSIGLYLVDDSGSHLAHVADGTLDAAIDDLGAFIGEAARPVFLRIGYEFDGSWNHYEPEGYKAAYRHIVERLRSQGVLNFASVWQSAAYALGTYQGLPLDAWYPGDDVVDWCGSSYFKFAAAPQQALLDFARAHEKPVMIAEATPQGYDTEALTHSETGDPLTTRTAQQIWDEWYAPFFAFVHQNADVVRAVAYINADWASQPMWGPSGGSGYWGDSRVEASAELQSLWLAEISGESWLHGSPDLFSTL